LKLHRRVAELGRKLSEELLEPTRIYTKITKKLFGEFRIKGAAHITGGGITGNLPRVLPQGRHAMIDRASWPVPPVFNLIQRIGGVVQTEMDATFNMGLGMIFVVAKQDADRVVGALKRIGERGFLIGEIRNGSRGATIRS
jgi:phosphoribosylformylglycinamidine cyclo-ligase